jgi:CheY-like chemotaxis protein
LILEDAGHEVLEATDGENALQVLRASQASLVVVLDLLMPRLSGIDVLQQVIADPHVKDRHAYLLMTADNALLRQQADPLLAQVSARVIGKPFDIDALLNMIDQASRFPV